MKTYIVNGKKVKAKSVLDAVKKVKDSTIKDSYVVLRKDEAFEESGAKSVAKKYNLQVKMDGYRNIFSGKEEDIIRMLYDYFKPQYAGQIELRIKDSAIKDAHTRVKVGCAEITVNNEAKAYSVGSVTYFNGRDERTFRDYAKQCLDVANKIKELESKGYKEDVMKAYDSAIRDAYNIIPGAIFKEINPREDYIRYIKITLVKNDRVTSNLIVKQGNQYKVIGTDETRKDLFIDRISGIYKQVSSLYDSAIRDANKDVSDIISYFNAWGYPPRSELQQVVDYYHMSKEDVKKVFGSKYSNTDLDNLKCYDSAIKDESMFMILNKDEGAYLYNVDISAAQYRLTNNANKADKFTLSEANRIINILKKYNFDNLTTSEFLDSKCKDANFDTVTERKDLVRYSKEWYAWLRSVMEKRNLDYIWVKFTPTQFGKFEKSRLQDVEPNKDESKEDFISRFMSETKEEYPDEKQRYAVANSYWERRNK